jgi:RsiW-degrading membrane proteinase PrsW (M82 family)
MTCSRCTTELPTGAAFCHACGADVARSDERGGGRGHTFAAQPGQPVFSFDIVSSLMPLAHDKAPQTYRTALMAGVAVVTLFALFGWLPSAFVAAALLVPVVYLVYLYDVNEWEDQPVPVVLGTFGLGAVLSTCFTLVWSELILDSGTTGRGNDGWSFSTLAITCLLVPVVAELLRQIGPVLLSRSPKFDDLIDSVTFGIATGAGWATAETLVLNRAMITGPSSVDGRDTALWWIVLITVGIVKPIVYGSATAIAVAGFSGIGERYDGFTRRYAISLAEAIGYGIVFQIGLYAGDRIGGQNGALFSLGIGVIVALAVIVRVRLVLHNGLLEAALEAARNDRLSHHAVDGDAWCGSCEMPLLPGAAFCSACGMAVRATGKRRRAFNEDPHANVLSGATTETEGN